ncbi:hypothetical protein EDI_343800 [Entamoeba dispar SAW760]|uniref:Transmembrane protein n=1 Tax=Entamoeba dispar (strain ATCC PRA-260 / SAW760) TaxID=370354 RepID=B0ESR1_ENTDS|nr:uncharacterized protein EDI_343800 [Entamoeba dispar SAW760]EDR22439.1 hypothetical protein EDI_343800 [Entamoeba dispar SAW760]|eukprot:EDR22439.1 hypothetical protein EDI_343800 [Entamoeba dispar SAW760]
MIILIILIILKNTNASWDEIDWTQIEVNEEKSIELLLNEKSNDYCNETEVIGRYLNISTKFNNIKVSISYSGYSFIHIFEERGESHKCYEQKYSEKGSIKVIINTKKGYGYIRIGTDQSNRTTKYIMNINIMEYNYFNEIIFISLLYSIALILLLIVTLILIGFYFYSNRKFKRNQDSQQLEEQNVVYQHSSLENSEIINSNI